MLFIQQWRILETLNLWSLSCRWCNRCPTNRWTKFARLSRFVGQHIRAECKHKHRDACSSLLVHGSEIKHCTNFVQQTRPTSHQCLCGFCKARIFYNTPPPPPPPVQDKHMVMIFPPASPSFHHLSKETSISVLLLFGAWKWSSSSLFQIRLKTAESRPRGLTTFIDQTQSHILQLGEDCWALVEVQFVTLWFKIDQYWKLWMTKFTN